jgi:hypothetical protein
MRETIDFARELPADWKTFGVAAPLYGTEMYEQFRAAGDIDDTFNYDDALFEKRAFDTAEISARELTEMMYTTNISVNFFGNYNMLIGDFGRALPQFRNVAAEYPWHVVAHYCVARCCRELGDREGSQKAMETCRGLISPGGNALSRRQFETFRDLFGDDLPPPPP